MLWRARRYVSSIDAATQERDVIASSMAGRRSMKSRHLVFIGTTSLYGQRPSQYDRTRSPRDGSVMSCTNISAGPLAWDLSISERTVRQLELLLAQSHTGTRVNSVFGRGVNPRLGRFGKRWILLGCPRRSFYITGRSASSMAFGSRGISANNHARHRIEAILPDF